ncbi:MAG: hypothetical protein ACK5M3_18310 [Dysgonomonas sp.]
MVENKKDDNVIEIFWETPIGVNNPQYKVFDRSFSDWDKGGSDYVKDMKIKELSVVIPRYSKYYEKYKPKETKSAEEGLKIKNPDGSVTVKRMGW